LPGTLIRRRTTSGRRRPSCGDRMANADGRRR
jgi:hypothetical protein